MCIEMNDKIFLTNKTVFSASPFHEQDIFLCEKREGCFSDRITNCPKLLFGVEGPRVGRRNI